MRQKRKMKIDKQLGLDKYLIIDLIRANELLDEDPMWVAIVVLQNFHTASQAENVHRLSNFD